MNKIVIGLGAVTTAATSICLFGIGNAAAAPDVVGMTHGDAVTVIEQSGGTARTAVIVGDRRDAMGDCLVTGATDAPFVRDDGGGFGRAYGEVLLTLNCNRGLATAVTPGASSSSPQGRAFKEAVERAVAEREQQAMAEAPDELPTD